MIGEFFRSAAVTRLVLLGVVVGAFGVAILAGAGEYIGQIVLVLGAIILLIGGAVVVFRWLDRARSSQTGALMLQGLSRFVRKSRTAMTPEQAADHEALAAKLEEGLSRYLKVSRKAKVSLAEAPFITIIGEPGGGKSELIRQSGLTFLDIDGLNDERAGTGGTEGMDWWFLPDHIIIDTAGKATVSEADRGAASADARPTDNPLWTQILQFLREVRPRCPINSVLIAIPMRSLLLDDETELRRKARHLAKSLDRLQDNTGVRCPVTVVITMSDLLPGYREFVVQHREHNTHTQMLGWSNPRKIEENEKFDPKSIEAHCAEVADRLATRRLALLGRGAVGEAVGQRRIDAMDGLYTLPHGLRMIAPRIREYLAIMFTVQASSIVEERRPPFLRGLYFASSCQQGGTLDPEVARMLGADPVALAREEDRRALPTPGGRSNGIQDLFKEKIFKETRLVTAAPHVRKMVRRRNAALIAAAGVAALFVAVLGYQLYKGGVSTVDDRVQKVRALNTTLVHGFAGAETLGKDLADQDNDAAVIKGVLLAKHDNGTPQHPPLSSRDWVKLREFEQAAQKFSLFFDLTEAATMSKSAGTSKRSEQRVEPAIGRTNDTWVLRVINRLRRYAGIDDREDTRRIAGRSALDAFIVQPLFAAAAEEIERDAPSARMSDDGLHTFGLVLDAIRLQDTSRTGTADDRSWKVTTVFDEKLNGPDLGAIRRHLVRSTDPVTASESAPGAPDRLPSANPIPSPPPLDLLSRALAPSGVAVDTQLLTLARRSIRPTIADSAFTEISADLPDKKSKFDHLFLPEKLAEVVKNLPSRGPTPPNEPACIDPEIQKQIQKWLTDFAARLGDRVYTEVLSSSKSDFANWENLIGRAIEVDTGSVDSTLPNDSRKSETRQAREWSSLLTKLAALDPQSLSSSNDHPSPWSGRLTTLDESDKKYGFTSVLDALSVVDAFRAPDNPLTVIPEVWTPGSLDSRLVDLEKAAKTSTEEIKTKLFVKAGSPQEALAQSLAACIQQFKLGRTNDLLASYDSWLRGGSGKLEIEHIKARVSDAAQSAPKSPRLTWIHPANLSLPTEELSQFDAQQGAAILRDLAHYPEDGDPSGATASDPWREVRAAHTHYKLRFEAIWGNPKEALAFAGCSACCKLTEPKPDYNGITVLKCLKDRLSAVSDLDEAGVVILDDAQFWIEQKQLAMSRAMSSSDDPPSLTADDRHSLVLAKIAELANQLPHRASAREIPPLGSQGQSTSGSSWQTSTLDNLITAVVSSINDQLQCSLPTCPDDFEAMNYKVPHQKADPKKSGHLSHEDWSRIVAAKENVTQLSFALKAGLCLEAAKSRLPQKSDYDWVEQWDLVEVKPGASGGLGRLQPKALLEGHFYLELEIKDHAGRTVERSAFDANRFGKTAGQRESTGPPKLDVALKDIASMHVKIVPGANGNLYPDASVELVDDKSRGDSWYRPPWAGVRLLRSACSVDAEACDVVVEFQPMRDGVAQGDPASLKLKFERHAPKAP